MQEVKQNWFQKGSTQMQRENTEAIIFEYLKSEGAVTEPQDKDLWQCMLPVLKHREIKLDNKQAQSVEKTPRVAKIPPIMHFRSQKHIQAMKSKVETQVSETAERKKFFIQNVKLAHEPTRASYIFSKAASVKSLPKGRRSEPAVINEEDAIMQKLWGLADQIQAKRMSMAEKQPRREEKRNRGQMPKIVKKCQKTQRICGWNIANHDHDSETQF